MQFKKEREEEIPIPGLEFSRDITCEVPGTELLFKSMSCSLFGALVALDKCEELLHRNLHSTERLPRRATLVLQPKSSYLRRLPIFSNGKFSNLYHQRQHCVMSSVHQPPGSTMNSYVQTRVTYPPLLCVCVCVWNILKQLQATLSFHFNTPVCITDKDVQIKITVRYHLTLVRAA